MDIYDLARPGLFALDPETAHQLTLQGLQTAARWGVPLPWRAPTTAPCRVMGIDFPNPIGLAAGLDKDGVAIDGLAALGFGFLEIGTVTRRPQPGNPKPRLFRLAAQAALINRMGFNNDGVDALVARLAARARPGRPLVLGINIGRNKDTAPDQTIADYCYCLAQVFPYASYIVVNLSSPNTPGLRDSQFGAALTELLDALRGERDRCTQRLGRQVPLLIKIAPDLAMDDVDAIVDTLVAQGLDGVVATNTTVSRPGLGELSLAREAGGLSGAPLAPLADAVLTRVVARAAGHLAIIAVGGVLSGADAARKRTIGADLVQVYSGLIFRGPRLVAEAVAACAAAARQRDR